MRTSKQFTVDHALYFLDNGMILCGAHCGTSAKYSGRDISGQRIERVTPEHVREATFQIACEMCGKTATPGAQ